MDAQLGVCHSAGCRRGCRTCGTRFAATQGSALFGLHLPAETIQQIIHPVFDMFSQCLRAQKSNGLDIVILLLISK